MRRSAPLRRSRLRLSPQKRTQKAVERVLDQLCRRLVVEIRDNNTCQRCGATAATHKIDWSHVVTRGAKSCRWAEWNSKALCAGCHRWWASHPIEAAEWWRTRWPDRAIEHGAWRHERRRPRLNRELVKRYLEERIRALSL